MTELVQKIVRFEEFKAKYNEAFATFSLESGAASKELDSAKQMQAVLKDLQVEGKSLCVGIVGRVKAGKSSLLNALIFDGEDVLPKAATPMTAALTVMKYSETRRAEVEFFTDKDIQDLKEDYDAQQALKKHFEAEEIEKEKQQPEHKQNFKRAEKRAEKRAQEDPSAAAADQYARILTSGIISTKGLPTEIVADTMAELNQKLAQYVSADGKYMPVTKSVTLYLPQENLKDLEVIDTPGVNDPVQSRGRRTEEMLSQCDVIFMVSPAGQFLSDQDLDLMQNMAGAKGIAHIYLVASQCDNQLHGNEYQALNLTDSLSEVGRKLSGHAHNTLTEAQKNHPYMGAIFKHFSQNALFLTSGLCYTLAKQTEKGQPLDEDQQFYHHQLKARFPTEFADSNTAISSLKRLANIDNIQREMGGVRLKKGEIIADKMNNYQAQQEKVLHEKYNHVAEKITEAETLLKENTLETLQNEKQRFNQLSADISHTVGEVYNKKIEELAGELNPKLNNKLKQLINQFEKGEKKEDYDTREESYSVKVGERSTSTWYKPWSWGSSESIYETRYRTVKDWYTYVDASPIRRSIEEILAALNEELPKLSNECQDKWKQALTDALNEALKKLDGKLNQTLVKNAIDESMEKLPKPVFEQEKLPSHLDKSGRLKNSSGENFMKEAEKYVKGLQERMEKKITAYIEGLNKELKAIQLADQFINGYQKDINKLEQMLADAESQLNKLAQIRQELQKIQ